MGASMTGAIGREPEPHADLAVGGQQREERIVVVREADADPDAAVVVDHLELSGLNDSFLHVTSDVTPARPVASSDPRGTGVALLEGAWSVWSLLRAPGSSTRDDATRPGT